MLFCRNEDCEKEMCMVCLIKYHKTHDFVELDEYRREITKTAFAAVDKVIAALRSFKVNMQMAKSVSVQQRVECIAKINESRAQRLKEIHNEYDSLVNDVDTYARETFSMIDDEITNMEENVRLMISMKKNSEAVAMDSYKELGTLHNIALQLQENLSHPRRFVYNDYVYEPGHGSENIRGNLQIKTLRVTYSEITIVERNQGTSSRIPCQGLLH